MADSSTYVPPPGPWRQSQYEMLLRLARGLDNAERANRVNPTSMDRGYVAGSARVVAGWLKRYDPSLVEPDLPPLIGWGGDDTQGGDGAVG